MEGKMKVAVMEGVGKMGFTERPIPTPKDDEVLVKLEYVGICGSDLHYYEHGRIGDYIVEPPFVLGHEPGGTVVEVGKDVKHLKVGTELRLSRAKHVDIVNSVKLEDTISVRMLFSLQHRLLMVCSRSM